MCSCNVVIGYTNDFDCTFFFHILESHFKWIPFYGFQPNIWTVFYPLGFQLLQQFLKFSLNRILTNWWCCERSLTVMCMAISSRTLKIKRFWKLFLCLEWSSFSCKTERNQTRRTWCTVCDLLSTAATSAFNTDRKTLHPRASWTWTLQATGTRSFTT